MTMFHIHMNIPPKRNSSLETFSFSFNLNASIVLREVLFKRPVKVLLFNQYTVCVWSINRMVRVFRWRFQFFIQMTFDQFKLVSPRQDSRYLRCSIIRSYSARYNPKSVKVILVPSNNGWPTFLVVNICHWHGPSPKIRVKSQMNIPWGLNKSKQSRTKIVDGNWTVSGTWTSPLDKKLSTITLDRPLLNWLKNHQKIIIFVQRWNSVLHILALIQWKMTKNWPLWWKKFIHYQI